ncbi:MAG: hypothetical protein U0531_09305 [Dehalococcoidia bacterium]
MSDARPTGCATRGGFTPRVAALRWVAGVYFLALGASLLLLPRPAAASPIEAVELRGVVSRRQGSPCSGSLP